MDLQPGPILPPPLLPDGTVTQRSPERTENIRRFQCELEVSITLFCQTVKLMTVCAMSR